MATVNFKTKQEVAQEALTNWRESATVSPFQAKAVLARNGYMAQVRQIINALDEDDETRIAWENATSFKRNSPTILALATQLNLTDEQLDALFEEAATIDA